MRGLPISRSSSGKSPLPQGSRVTVKLTPRSLVTARDGECRFIAEVAVLGGGFGFRGWTEDSRPGARRSETCCAAVFLPRVSGWGRICALAAWR